MMTAGLVVESADPEPERWRDTGPAAVTAVGAGAVDAGPNLAVTAVCGFWSGAGTPPRRHFTGYGL
jgi:hypothetical protein